MRTATDKEACRPGLHHFRCCAQGKGAGDGGMLGRMRSALADGLGWLTSGRKRRGVMASMQGAASFTPELLMMSWLTSGRKRRGVMASMQGAAHMTAGLKRPSRT